MGTTLALTLVIIPASYAQWIDVATISSTLTNTSGRLCIGGGRTDLGCPADAPLLDRASGLLTVPGGLRVVGQLYVSGSQTFDGVTFANGGISASSLTINGAPVTSGIPDRITSNSQAGVIANQTGYISLTTGGVTGTVYFTPGGRLVNAGISTTGIVSAASIYLPPSPIGLNGANLMTAPTQDGFAFAADTTSSFFAAPNNHLFIGTSRSSAATDDIRFFSTNASGTIYPMTIKGDTGNVGIGISSTAPSTSLHVLGTVRIGNGSETCDTDRLGAMRYTAGAFYICRNTSNGWEPLATTGANSNNDRIISGTTQAIAYQDTSLSLVTAGVERVVIGANGNIGIGQQPAGAFALTVSGSLSARNYTATSSGFFAPTNGGLYWGGTAANGINGNATSQHIAFVTSSTEALRIVSSGFVGFGLTAPSATIHASGSIVATSDLSVGEKNGTATPRLIFKRSQDGNGNAYIGLQAISGSEMRAFNASGSSYYTWYTNDGVGTLERMRLNQSGSFGISTTNPSTTLHVAGTIRMADGGEACDANRLGALKYTSNAFYICQSTLNGWEPLATATSSTNPSINTGLSGSIVFRDQSGYLKAYDTFSISSTTGAVGIGAGAPAALGNNGLYVGGALQSVGKITADSNIDLTGNLTINSSGAVRFVNNQATITGNANNGGALMFNVSQSEALRIVSTGNVGIGTTAPSATLEVSGDVIIGARGRTYTLGFRRLNDGSTNTSFGYKNGSSNEFQFRNVGGGGYYTWITNDTSNADERMRLTPQGRLGISTTAPNTLLDVAGSIRIAAETSATLNTCDSSRLGAIKYESSTFQICQSTLNGWEPLATATSSTNPSINTGLSGSIVYRDEYGYLKANNTFSVSSTTGSIGIGAGAPASVGNNGLYVAGIIRTPDTIYGTALGLTTGNDLFWGNATSKITGDSTNKYIAFTTSGTEALRIVSTGYVGLGFTAPSATLQVSDSGSITGNSGGGIIIGPNNGQNLVIGRNSIAARSNGSYAGLLLNAYSNNPVYLGGAGGSTVGIGTGPVTPSTTLTISGSLRLAAEPSSTLNTCDTNRLGAIKYESSTFQICQSTLNGWEPLATATSSTNPSINTGLSGSIVFRDEYGYLKANNTFSISATTGSIGIGAGAPASLGNSGLYVSGSVTTNANLNVAQDINASNGYGLQWNNGVAGVNGGGSTNSYVRLLTNSTEALRVVSTGYVGIGTSAPSSTLHVSGISTFTNTAATPAIIVGSSAGSPRLGIMAYGTQQAALQARSSDNTAGIQLLSQGGLQVGSLYLNEGTSPNKGRFVFGEHALGSTSTRSTMTVNGGMNIRDDLFIGAAQAIPSTTLHVSGTLRIADGLESCDTDRLGAIKYTTGAFYICKNTSNGWEPVATTTSSTTPSINTGLSGSIVFRDESGYLKAYDTFSISSTTGSVGIGAGAPASVGSDGLYAQGAVFGSTGLMTNGAVTINGSSRLRWDNNNNSIIGHGTQSYLAFTTSGTEALRIVSTGYVGIGTTAPSSTLHVVGAIQATDFFRSGGGGTTGGLRLYTSSGGLLTNLTPTGGYIGASVGSMLGIGLSTPSQTLHISGTLLTTSWTGINFGSVRVTPTAPLEVSGTISATALTINGQPVLGGAGTFASLTDVSYSLVGNNIFGPGSTAGAVANSVSSTTVFGSLALNSASNASHSNSAFGAYALGVNTTGSWNNAFGRSALSRNTSGGSNVAVGVASLLNNTTGASNIAVGHYALSSNTTGGANIAIGHYALSGVSITGDSIGIGKNTGGNMNGARNLFIGNFAGQSYAAGDTSVSNTLIGYNAGGGLTTGSNNMVIGAGVSPFSSTGSSQLAIANAIWGNIGSGTGNANLIGINVTSPTANLEVSGTVSATRFVGDGSLLTNLPAGTSDRITSATSGVYVSDTGVVTIATAGTNSGFFNAAGLNTVGVSSSGGVTATTGTFTNDITTSGDITIYGPNSLKFNTHMTIANFSTQNTISLLTNDTLQIYNGTDTSAAGLLYATKRLRFGGIAGTSAFSINTGQSSSTLNVSGTARITSWTGINMDTTPTTPLEVSGTVSATRFVGDGSLLTNLPSSVGDRITSGTTGVYTSQNTSVSIATAGTERMVIGANGLVGIGQQPVASALLSVSGTRINLNGVPIMVSGTSMGIFTPHASYSGTQNVIFGDNAGAALTTGYRNVLIGSDANKFNSGGYQNTFIGTGAGTNAAGSSNVAMGYNAGTTLTGQNAIAIGSGAATGITAGGGIYIGANTSATGPAITNFLNIGNTIFGRMTNASAIGGAALVGINMPTPTVAFEVSGTISATSIVLNGVSLTQGVSTYASLTDVSYSANNGSFGGNLGGPNSFATSNPISRTTAFGIGALTNASLSGSHNSAFGHAALTANTSGANNSAFGKSSLQSNTSGVNNAAFGFSALISNSTGGNNVAVGTNAMYNNTSSYNTAVGTSALYTNNTGTNNSAFGNTALYANISGDYNNAFGAGALYTNTGGSNSAFGSSTMRSNTSGSNNVAMGGNALVSNTTGNGSSAIGVNSLRYNVGSYNAVVGYNAGSGDPAGTSTFINSTLMGAYAGQSLTTGNSNTLIGYNAAGGLTTGSNNIVIGASISPFSNTGSNQLNIGDSIFGDLRGSLASRIGINVTSATVALEVSGTVSATRFVGDGSGLTNLPSSTGDRITSSTTGVYTYQDTSVSIATAGTERMVVGANGLVGIAMQPHVSFTLGVSGTLYSASNTWVGGDLSIGRGRYLRFVNNNNNTPGPSMFIPSGYNYMTFRSGSGSGSGSTFAFQNFAGTVLSVMDGSGNMGIGPGYDGTLPGLTARLEVSGTSWLKGNVGIGTSTSLPLTVSGASILQGNVGIGAGMVTATTALTVSGTTSTTMLNLGTNTATACGSGQYGTIKVENGRMYMCRQ